MYPYYPSPYIPNYCTTRYPPRSIKTLQSRWQSPSLNLRYDQVCFLTSHNSYSSIAYGYIYAQQNLSITDQLNYGVRGLMLDTYRTGDTISLCHQSCELTTTLLKPIPSGPPNTLNSILQEVISFLNQNPQEIVTIIYEDYVKNPQFFDEQLEKIGIAPYTLATSDWDAQRNQGWPTLDWLVSNNKRVLMFTSSFVKKGNYVSRYLYPQWQNMVENQYSTTKVEELQLERCDSGRRGARKTRYLYAFNCFPEISLDVPGFNPIYKDINTTKLTDGLNYCVREGLIAYKDPSVRICQHRYPNYLCLDYVEVGYGLDYVNKMNEQAGSNEWFASIPPYLK